MAPGISVSKLAIPFRTEGGISWDNYWTSLISAVVENAAPTDVVLTFPIAQASLVATDFTIAGFTINSASWTGAVLTLVLSTAVVYTDSLIVTFVKTGGTAVVTNNVLQIPVVSSAQITDADPNKVAITFNIAMDATSIPATSAFTLTGKSISNVAISGAIVTLTVTVAYSYGNSVTVNYIQPGSDKLKSSLGGIVASFSNQVVTNNIIPYFITTWQTENAGSATKTIVIPTTGAGYDCWVTWGDGSAEENFVGTPGNITHVYATTGIKTIKIRGLFPRIYFNNGGDRLKLLTIAQWGSIVWSSMAGAFYGCSNMTGTYTDVPDTSNVTSMAYMFMYTPFNQVVNFNTGAVTNMGYMFAYNIVFNQGISGWDIRLITAMTSFLVNNTVFSTANYNALLIAWSAQAVKNSVPAHFGIAKYTQTLVDSGTTDGAAAGKLIQSGQNFVTTVTIGDVVRNTTDGTYAIVTAIDSDTQLSISVDIMVSGKAFTIQHSDAAKGRAHLVLSVANGGHAWSITDGGPI